MNIFIFLVSVFIGYSLAMYLTMDCIFCKYFKGKKSMTTTKKTTSKKPAVKVEMKTGKAQKQVVMPKASKVTKKSKY